MRRARWLLVLPLLAVGWFVFRAGTPEPQDVTGQNGALQVKTAAIVQPPNRPPPPPTRASQGPPPQLPPPVINQPQNVPENVPPGLQIPAANYAPDGGVVFPLDKRGIHAALEEARPDMQRCYAQWLIANPELGGTLNLSFTVRPTDGGDQATIDEVHLHGRAGVGNAAFEGCVLNVVSELRFESPPQGAVEVRVPMSFSSAGWDAGR